jgi:undecaprenyl-diphosphatase
VELLLKALVLGLVEGVTEFLPISSTGHLIIVNQFIDFTGPFAKTFDVVIQLGAILSVVVYFRNRLFSFNHWKKAAAGVLPAILIGGALGRQVQEYLFNPLTVALSLFVGGIVLILVERRNKPGLFFDLSALTYSQAVAIGLFQCLAMVPGTSRAAATIIGAMVLGASRPVAVEFSFFLAIPTMAAASGYSLLSHRAALGSAEWMALAIGFIVSFLVAWGVIAFLMNYIRKHNFILFAYYRIGLAALIGVLLYAGLLR